MNRTFERTTFLFLVVFILLISHLLGTAEAGTSFYLEGIRFQSSPHTKSVKVVPLSGNEFRHTRHYYTGVLAFHYFLRGSIDVDYSYIYYPSKGDGAYLGIGFTGGIGLFHPIVWYLDGRNISLFFGVFSANRWYFAGDHDIFRMSIEAGLAINFQKISISTTYKDRAFILGLSYGL